MPTFAIITFGCKVNQYESQAIRELLCRAGYTEVSPAQLPDVCVVNACAVTQATENECRRTVRRLIACGGAGKMVLTGCSSEAIPFSSFAECQNVLVVRKEKVSHIVNLLAKGEPRDAFHGSVFDLSVSGHAGHVRAFLKIQDGCSAACSYCIVPRARGPAHSRPLADILAEAQRLTQNGFLEIVLTGVHIGGYGADLGGQINLVGLLRQLLDVKGIRRIRLGSLEMRDLSDELINLAADDKRICPHFHVPLQSGDDGILRRMNRVYSVAEYVEKMEQVKARLDLPALTTDVIVGFPGESEAAFANTLDTCRRVAFSRIHVFSFSPRPGTPAFSMGDRVAPHIIRRRKEQLMEIASHLAQEYRRQMIGRQADLLIEYGRDQRTGLLHGHTERYVGVLVEGLDSWAGKIVRVRIAEMTEGHLRGIVVTSP